MKEENTSIDMMLRQMERRNRAMARMTQDLAWLIAQPDDSVKWNTTQTDLVEMVHLVWQQRTLIGPDGMPYTRIALARKAFAAIGRPVPHSLPHIVLVIQNRVNPNRSILCRYEFWENESNIMNHFADITRCG